MIGIQEIVLILVILLGVFGPKKLPELAKELGKAYKEFKKASANITDTASSIWKDIEDEENSVLSIANNLEIDTNKKSVKQLIQEIEKKIVKDK
jgi:sec-independent protein translocase protein TatA